MEDETFFLFFAKSYHLIRSKEEGMNCVGARNKEEDREGKERDGSHEMSLLFIRLHNC